MINFDNIFNKGLYSYKKKKKQFFFTNYIKVNNHHYKNCEEFKKFFNNFKTLNSLNRNKLEDFSMLPVNIFKQHQLFSVPKNKIVKKMTSSGTSSKNLSNIFLDKENSINQRKNIK